jgi:tRNA uridine 5-carboxymethylaminomethyl modification enzyme
LKARGVAINQDGVRRSAFALLGYPDMSWSRLSDLWPELAGVAPEIAEQLEIEGRYAGYLDRQDADIAAFRRDEELALPDDLDYGAIGSLSTEVRTKLAKARPATLGAAGRIPGVTAAALTSLLAHVKRTGRGQAA